jgi:hypothetical protein
MELNDGMLVESTIHIIYVFMSLGRGREQSKI